MIANDLFGQKFDFFGQEVKKRKEKTNKDNKRKMQKTKTNKQMQQKLIKHTLIIIIIYLIARSTVSCRTK